MYDYWMPQPVPGYDRLSGFSMQTLYFVLTALFPRPADLDPFIR